MEQHASTLIHHRHTMNDVRLLLNTKNTEHENRLQDSRFDCDDDCTEKNTYDSRLSFSFLFATTIRYAVRSIFM